MPDDIYFNNIRSADGSESSELLQVQLLQSWDTWGVTLPPVSTGGYSYLALSEPSLTNSLFA